MELGQRGIKHVVVHRRPCSGKVVDSHLFVFGCSSPAFAGGNARLLVLGYNQSLYIRNDLHRTRVG